jgi:hypothetical protein
VAKGLVDKMNYTLEIEDNSYFQIFLSGVKLPLPYHHPCEIEGWK